MKTKEDWFLYIKLVLLLTLPSLISFEGTVIACLSYLIALAMINYNKN